MTMWLRSVKFSRSFSVKAESRQVFELAREYFENTQFIIRKAVIPVFIVLDRGTRLGSFTGTELGRYRTTLTLSFNQDDDETVVLCFYDITVYGILTTDESIHSKLILKKEVKDLQSFINRNLQRVLSIT